MISALLTLSIFTAGAPYPQAASFERIAKCFQSLQSAAPARWPPTDVEMRRLLDLATRCGWAMVVEKLTPAEAEAIAGFDLKFEEASGPAAWVQGTTIHVSFDGIAQAGQVGRVVGHDIFVDDGHDFPVPSRVAYGPLASQPIIGLTNRLSEWIDGAASATQCQAVECQTVQGLALFLGIDGFLLAHEAAHVILRHGATDSGQNELAADRWAYGLLRRYDSELSETDTLRLARTAARLAPIVYFDYLRSRLATEGKIAQTLSEIELLGRRRQQLLELADKDDRLTLETLGPSIDTGIGRVVIAVEGDIGPSANFWIDGVPLRAGEVLGRERIVAIGVRHIAARAAGRFAYVTEVIGVGDRKSVRLRFSEPLPSLPLAALQEMSKRRQQSGEEKWAQIFLHTTDEAGQPRSPDVALLHYEALSRMRLGSLIPENPPNITDARALRSIRRWREGAQPLSSWW